MMDVIIGLMVYCLVWISKELSKWPNPPPDEDEHTTPRDPFYIPPPLQGLSATSVLVYCLIWLTKEMSKWPSPPKDEEAFTQPPDPFYVPPPLQG